MSGKTSRKLPVSDRPVSGDVAQGVRERRSAGILRGDINPSSSTLINCELLLPLIVVEIDRCRICCRWYPCAVCPSVSEELPHIMVPSRRIMPIVRNSVRHSKLKLIRLQPKTSFRMNCMCVLPVDRAMTECTSFGLRPYAKNQN